MSDQDIEYYTRIIEDPNSSDDDKAKAYTSRGSVYFQQEEYEQAEQDFNKAIALNPYYASAYVYRGILYLKIHYQKAIDCLNTALQQGISNGFIKLCKEKKLLKDASLAMSIFAVFESVARILNELKVQKDSQNAVKYLSHTTKLSVFTQNLMPPLTDETPGLAKFRMYHIACANDPTEGKVLLNTLEVLQDKAEKNSDIPYVIVASFCAGEKPKALDTLPIWNMYGDNAQGIALLFNTKDIAYGEAGHAIPTYLQPKFKNISDDTKEQKSTNKDLQDEQSKGKTLLPQILYKVHYIKKDSEAVDTSKNPVDKEIQNIRKKLKEIKSQEEKSNEQDKKTLPIYNKSLELLNGLRYLVKDATYSYEHEYRLLCFANKEDIPKILKRETPKEQGEQRRPRIYVETDILKELRAVLTAPKLSKEEILDIQYVLHWYKEENKFSKIEDKPVHTSAVLYR